MRERAWFEATKLCIDLLDDNTVNVSKDYYCTALNVGFDDNRTYSVSDEKWQDVH